MHCNTTLPEDPPPFAGGAAPAATPKVAHFQSVPPSPTGTDHSELTLESSLGGSSVVSLSQLSTVDIPKIPSPSAHLKNERVLRLLHPHDRPRRAVLSRHKATHESFDYFNTNADDFFGGFSVEEVKKTYKFISGDLDIESKSFVGFDGEHFEAAFRKVKRARKQKSLEEEARKFMRTFRFLLQLSNKSPEQWFVETDTTPDCKLTWSEFEAGMQKLCTDLGGAMFSKNGLLAMLRYMDPFCLGELTAPEVKAAFKRIKLPSKSGVILSEAGEVFTFLQEFIQQRAVRVQDLFNLFDIERRKAVDFRDFCFGIDRLRELIVQGGLLAEKAKPEAKRPTTKPFDPIIGNGSLGTDPAMYMSLSSSRLSGGESARQTLPRGRSKALLKPIPKEEKGVSDGICSAVHKNSKPRIPPSPIRCPVVDSVAMRERKRLLNGIKLARLPPPTKVNYKDIVQKGVNQYEPWLHHFDSTLKTGLILHSQS